MLFNSWGARPDEIDAVVVGDDICANARVSATRCITIPAPPQEVFPWIRQMGFGRAGWYSYDWLDNLGRKSAQKVHPEWQDISTGSHVPAGPIAFIAARVDEPHSFVLSTSPKGFGKRMCFTLAYELRPDPAGTRLVTRMRVRINMPGAWFLEKFLLSPGDGLMVRKQLLTLQKNISEIYRS